MLRKILGITLLTVCGLLLLSFAVTMLGGIVNHGSVIGSIYCLSVILLYIFYPKLKSIRVLRILSRILTVIFAAAAVYSAVISAFMLSAMMNTPEKAIAAGTFSAEQPQTVIILGCQAINGKPSLMLEARLDKGAEFLNENPSAVCIVTGGQGGNEIEPESVSMRRYLLSKGINENRIYTEETSANTRENIANAKRMIDENGLPKNVVTVSESYHLYRALRIAERNGLNASAESAFSAETWYALPANWVREIIAVTVDYVIASPFRSAASPST